MQSVGDFLTASGEFFAQYIAYLSRLPQLWKEDQTTFFLVAGSLFVVLLILILLLVFISRRKRKEASPDGAAYKQNKAQRKFVPVESSGSDLDTVFLPLADRILACRDCLDPDVESRIRKNSPRTLADIVAAFERSTPPVKVDLTRLVRELKMMEAYSRKLDDNKYPQGVLVDAWACFPDDAVLRTFVELLASRDDKMQRAAVRLLSALQEPKSLPMLILALVQPERYLPARVAEVFMSMPTQSAALLTYMLPEIDAKHQESVLEIIAQTEATFEPYNVLTCLRDKDYRIRAAAALALGAGRITTAMPNLLLAAGDQRWQVRAAAAKALGLMGDSRGIPALEALAHDKEGWVGSSAKESLALFGVKK